MNNFTLNKVLDHILYDVEAVLSNVSDNDLRDMTPEDVCELLENNHYYVTEVIYYSDAWEIVAGSQFNNYSAEYLDFTNCKNSIDCVMHEAQGILLDVYFAEREKIASEVLESLRENLADESEDE